MIAQKHQEIESKLIITAQDPAAILQQIARKSALLKYQLIKCGRINLRDIYLDTPDFQLKQQRLALRLRKSNNRYYLTLKGKSKLTSWGGVERLEIELPWSGKSYRQIIEILKENDILIDSSQENPSTASPIDILKNPAFTIIQDRETRRLIRKVVSVHRQRKELAELALDTVTFHLVDQTVLHTEIELEAKVRDGLDTVRELTEYLVQKYPENLRSWPISKLSTGKLIEQLHQEENIQNFLNRQNYLLPLAFKRIAKKIDSIRE
ncbi:MAG: hypothetical protein A2Y94_09385 [Caldithrix sp. RBG_13_44_9]|nr:MAG: hypothetical protein A2Y94_09385 [Caldithrix sp. RBG_13_44_9]